MVVTIAWPANLCAAFEALVGAMYLDQVWSERASGLRGFYTNVPAEIDAQRASKDAKSLLQEYTQASH